LADQHAGNSLRVPFLGHDCSTSPAPALFALRYHCALYTAICYRTGLAQWRVECGREILIVADGKARPSADIMRDINQAFEEAVRHDPANWFWVHDRWKAARKQATAASASTSEGQFQVPPAAATELDE
jgi:KDO2-lipid IV(A) lauroyltransferase